MRNIIRCSKCGYTTVINDRGLFDIPDETTERCEFIIQQKRRGKVEDWQCPTLTAEVERVLYGHSPKSQ
jgi:hypothetical protein